MANWTDYLPLGPDISKVTNAPVGAAISQGWQGPKAPAFSDPVTIARGLFSGPTPQQKMRERQLMLLRGQGPYQKQESATPSPEVYGAPGQPLGTSPEVFGAPSGAVSPDAAAGARAASGLQGTTVEQQQKPGIAPGPVRVAARPMPQSAPAQPDIDPLRQKYAELQDRIHKMNQNAPKKPDAPENDPMKAFLSVGAMIGVLGGMLTRQPLVSGLNALTAAGQARKENDMQQYDLKMKEFSEYMKFVHDTEKQSFDVLKAINEDKHMTQQEKLKALEVELRARGISVHAAQIQESMRHREAMEQRFVMTHNDSLFQQAGRTIEQYTKGDPTKAKGAVDDLTLYKSRLAPGQFVDPNVFSAIMVKNGLYSSETGSKTLQEHAAMRQQAQTLQSALAAISSDASAAKKKFEAEGGVDVGGVKIPYKDLETFSKIPDTSSIPPRLDYIKKILDGAKYGEVLSKPQATAEEAPTLQSQYTAAIPGLQSIIELAQTDLNAAAAQAQEAGIPIEQLREALRGQ